ncbi:RmlC-like cupin domain-containing protein [Lineolata rhizophorae]|uniref:RmlC-like cupin domain-containing protein n=1 Tax=Lineolata rhizophorae TaxID=578093 RepID=A0A6A6NLY1_9PEZI|nr:RmlC-like cupin domain-containing protein [Lineolata rhizophorae]
MPTRARTAANIMAEVPRVVKGSSLTQSGGQTAGMVRMNAVHGMSDRICSLVMTAEPHTSSVVHHHGDQDTVVYAVRGRGAILSGPNGSNRHELAPGDFAFIPAWAEHQEVNDGEELVLVVMRTGREPETCSLDGWVG